MVLKWIEDRIRNRDVSRTAGRGRRDLMNDLMVILVDVVNGENMMGNITGQEKKMMAGQM
jgi:hypothetical protein